MSKRKFTDNHFDDILRLFDVLSNFPFTKSEMKRDYLQQTWYIRATLGVAERLKT